MIENNNSLTLVEIQQYLLEILKAFDAYCVKNGIQYFLSGGSLLGAIRHHGFIPWDDDVDVMMPRPDYDRFFSLLGNDLIEDRYELVSISNGKSNIPFAKLLDKKIKIKESVTGMSKYLWIDIFPLDALPEDLTKSNQLLQKAMRIKYYYSLATSPIGSGTTKFRAIIKFPFVLYHRWNNRDNKYAKQLVGLCDKNAYDTAEYIGGITWSCGPCERMRKKELYPAHRIEFESITLTISNNYDSYLRKMYNDYMVIPEKSNRKSHRYTAGLSGGRNIQK